MKTVAAFVWILSVMRVLAAETSRPNILFIYTDDQSQRTLGCYRDEGAWPWVHTPNIDRIAAEGVRFTTAYGASWCSPSRACVMTGLLPHGIHGVHLRGVTAKGEAYDPQAVRFWPAELRKSGYTTAHIGKWHIGQNAGHGTWWDHSVVWDQNVIKGDWYNNQDLSIDGAPPKTVPGYTTDVFTRFASDFIRQKHDKPWMLWLCYNAPHLPNTTHPRHKDLYTDAPVEIPADIFGPRPHKPAYMHEYTMFKTAEDGSPRYGGKPLPDVVRAYNRLVSAVDEGVGELRRALEESGQLDNTLIIYTSDQGFAWGEHGFAWKVGPYDACLRMPLLFRLPGPIAKGGVCKQPATIVDVIPTLLGFAQVPLPWEMHGHDLRPLLRDPSSGSDRPVMMEHIGFRFGDALPEDVLSKAVTPRNHVPWWQFLRQGRYKYVNTLVPDEMEELYDLESDPQELKNLALDASFRSMLEEYRDKLKVELKRTGAAPVFATPFAKQ
ncbi:sulfatase-like hydrolase/transferase [Prosthecobacter sp.]|uniref:sulfatase-like hydrolase/transferase n=1 Tax=Prosthecobacter sp. TaxID=1965333 RepID=UPI001D7BD01B|nr:sulfatase-like hydrolase/transferase [Prosthecobacter sp.]MCB1276377.1 sulfatase-like hydrolase/transferase [Prosthecobacter sp.]